MFHYFVEYNFWKTKRNIYYACARGEVVVAAFSQQRVSARRCTRPVLARIPFAEGNMEWLRDGRRLKPDWCAQFKAWEIPTAWFDSVIKLALRRHQEVYVIQLYREHQKCAPACWNASGFHCECSCMGENHGSGHPGGNWYEVSETFAVSWGQQRYSCRHLKVKNTGR